MQIWFVKEKARPFYDLKSGKQKERNGKVWAPAKHVASMDRRGLKTAGQFDNRVNN